MKYPDIFPVEAVQHLIQAASSPKTANTKVVVASGYELLGFALGQFVGEPTTLFGEPESFNGLLTSRDPAKEKRIQAQVIGLLSLAYGASLFNKDPGIPAALLAVNSVVLKEWTNIADAYWSAKGL
jgi:hypothetical protein